MCVVCPSLCRVVIEHESSLEDYVLTTVSVICMVRAKHSMGTHAKCNVYVLSNFRDEKQASS